MVGYRDSTDTLSPSILSFDGIWEPIRPDCNPISMQTGRHTLDINHKTALDWTQATDTPLPGLAGCHRHLLSPVAAAAAEIPRPQHSSRRQASSVQPRHLALISPLQQSSPPPSTVVLASCICAAVAGCCHLPTALLLVELFLLFTRGCLGSMASSGSGIFFYGPPEPCNLVVIILCTDVSASVDFVTLLCATAYSWTAMFKSARLLLLMKNNDTLICYIATILGTLEIYMGKPTYCFHVLYNWRMPYNF